MAATVEASGAPDHAVRLLAVAAALRALTDTPVLPKDQARYDERLARLRQALGDAAFDRAWAAGRAQQWEVALGDGVG